MTKEERNDAIDFFKQIAGKERGKTKYSYLAIEALEQEPFINKPCVSENVCEHDKQMVIDKIRAEIEQFAKNPDFGDLSIGASCGAMKAIEIIDKYRAESEDN